MATKQGPTPGPWEISRKSNTTVCCCPGGIAIAACGIHSGNSKDSGELQAGQEANARLIAAAPDLRDALLLFIDIWNSSGDASNGSKRAQKRRVDMWDKVNAALEKAGVQR